ncbi:MAG: hypothetical protein MK135_00430 [Polyangiaceae bacterium]|nr:hypothetical protein [Polyangiaceae bacterium]
MRDLHLKRFIHVAAAGVLTMGAQACGGRSADDTSDNETSESASSSSSPGSSSGPAGGQKTAERGRGAEGQPSKEGSPSTVETDAAFQFSAEELASELCASYQRCEPEYFQAEYASLNECEDYLEGYFSEQDYFSGEDYEGAEECLNEALELQTCLVKSYAENCGYSDYEEICQREYVAFTECLEEEYHFELYDLDDLFYEYD